MCVHGTIYVTNVRMLALRILATAVTYDVVLREGGGYFKVIWSRSGLLSLEGV